jgi:predicted phage terminase large subunit-like protein
LLICDDLTKGSEDAYSLTARKSLQVWYESVAYTRLQPNASIVMIATRWHTDDLVGWRLREHAADGWQVVSLPALAEPNDPLNRSEGEALWPSKFPVEALTRIREAIGSSAWSSLYQQRPVAAEGAIFKREWLKSFTGQPECYRIIFSLDTAFKTGESNDYSVIGIFGETQNGFYLLDMVRERLDFPALKSRTIAKAAYWKPSAVLIEDAASGQSLIQTLKLETRLPILPVKPLGDKESRASSVSPLFESGRIYLPQQAPWLSDFIDELTSFPAAPHDDQVDSCTQALTWLHQQNAHSYHDYVSIPRGATSTPSNANWLARAGYRESAEEAQRNYESDMIGERRQSPWDSFAPRMGSWGRQRGF